MDRREAPGSWGVKWPWRGQARSHPKPAAAAAAIETTVHGQSDRSAAGRPAAPPAKAARELASRAPRLAADIPRPARQVHHPIRTRPVLKSGSFLHRVAASRTDFSPGQTSQQRGRATGASGCAPRDRLPGVTYKIARTWSKSGQLIHVIRMINL